jgi:hypothetical protein
MAPYCQFIIVHNQPTFGVKEWEGLLLLSPVQWGLVATGLRLRNRQSNLSIVPPQEFNDRSSK